MKDMAGYQDTITQIYDGLLSLASRVSSRGRCFEFGDSPDFVAEMGGGLRELKKTLESLGSYFDLETVPFKKANSYFKASRLLGEAIGFVEEVQDWEYGSRENTKSLLRHLNVCGESLDNLGKLEVP